MCDCAPLPMHTVYASAVCPGNKVVTLSHRLLGSLQGVPKNPHGVQEASQEFTRSPKGVPQGIPKESMWTSLSIALVLPDCQELPRTPYIILIKRRLFQKSTCSPTRTDQELCKDSCGLY